MINREEIISIGKFQRTHALKGELNMISEIDPEYFLEGNPLIIEYDGILVPYYVEGVRTKGATSFLVKIDGIESEDEATRFVNKEIFVIKKNVEKWLGEEIYDSHYLLGYSVIDSKTGEIIGEIKDIDSSTLNELFILEKDDKEIIIPANEDLILDIDNELKRIKIEIPEGLFDL